MVAITSIRVRLTIVRSWKRFKTRIKTIAVSEREDRVTRMAGCNGMYWAVLGYMGLY